MNDLDPIIKSNNALLIEVQKAENRVSELQGLVESYKKESDSIIAEADFTNDSVVDTLSRNRVRAELAPRAIKLAEETLDALELKIEKAISDSLAALQPYYKAIDDVLLPQAKKIMEETFPTLDEESQAWRNAYTQTKPYLESEPHRYRGYFANSSSAGMPTRHNLENVTKELGRAQKQHAQLIKERKSA